MSALLAVSMLVAASRSSSRSSFAAATAATFLRIPNMPSAADCAGRLAGASAVPKLISADAPQHPCTPVVHVDVQYIAADSNESSP